MATSESGGKTPPHLRAPKPRRDYYSRQPVLAVVPTPTRPTAGGTPSVEDAVVALIRHHGNDWAAPTLRNCRHYLLLGRFPAFCEAEGIRTIHELTTERIEDFLTQQGALLKPGTVTKYRTYLRALARFCASTPGYHTAAMADIDRIPRPRQPRFKAPVALTREEEAQVVEAVAKPPFSVRDRLLVELLLACGLRVSELCALLVDDLRLTNRPPYLHVRGSVHDRDRTKNGEDRSVPFRSSYNTLPRRLEAFIATDRDPEGTSERREVFLSKRRDASGRLVPLTIWGVEELMQRLSIASGIHCNPHKMRHTFATRSVDAGIPVFHLQQAGGWRSIEMVRRYYTADTREVLESYENAHLG